MRRGILATRDELRQLHDRIGQKPFDAFYERLRKRCALILESAPMTEMSWQSAWEKGRYNAATAAARAVQGRILDLAISDALDANGAYRSRAIEELRNLARWSTWSDPSRPNLSVNLCTAEAAVATLIGLDWLWDFLDDTEREEFIETLRERVIGPYLKEITSHVWWYTAVNHWNAVINSACGMTGLALRDRDDLAAEVYDRSREGLNCFFADLGREGGWDEGIGYWGYAMRFVLLLAEAAMRLEDDKSLLHHRGMDATGLFPIYFTPNGRGASFGDAGEPPLHGSLYLLGRHFRCRELLWWLDTYSFVHDISISDWSRAGLAMLFRPTEDGVVEPKLQPLKVYRQIGWSAMADTWPRPRMYCSVKTGDLATSHAQRDMNSLQFQMDGEMMLIDVGHPPETTSRYFSSERDAYYEVHARAHNTWLVAGEDHRPDARGQILNSHSDERSRWVLADAGQACGENTRFRRLVAMLLDGEGRGQSLVVLDQLMLAVPERAEMFWHTGGEIDFDAGKLMGLFTGRRSQLHMAMASTVPLEVTVQGQQLEHRRRDNYLHVSAGLMGPCYVLSVFSRDPIGKAELDVRPDATVGATFDGTVLQFAETSGGLVLESYKQE